MKKLDNLKWNPSWISAMGCIKGCLDYLGLEVSNTWLYGASGYGFVINIHEVVCPSGPTAWQNEILFKLAPNIGFRLEGTGTCKFVSDFKKIQKSVWDDTRKNIDKGVPCYGWELSCPEYAVVYGYDDIGYYFKGPGADDGGGPKPWNELGETEIGMIEMYSVHPNKSSSPEKTVKEVFQAVIKHSQNPKEWIFEKYGSGPKAYEIWIEALKNEVAHPMGMAYNSIVWHECRFYAVEFLKQAKNKLGSNTDSDFDLAVENYSEIEKALREVSEMFPFKGMNPKHVKDKERVSRAIELLDRAREFEIKGLKNLETIAEKL